MLVPVNIHVVGNVMDGAKMICVLREFVKFWMAENRKISPTLGVKYSLMTGLIFDPSRRPVCAVEQEV